MIVYPDGSSVDDCCCDGTEDGMYTCDYHSENWEEEFYPPVTRGYSSHQLVDAYGYMHYKSGVYDV